MNIPKRKLRIDLIVIVLWLFTLLLLAWRVEAQTIVNWEPQANGIMAITWERGEPDQLVTKTFHSIRCQSVLPLSVEDIVEQAQADGVWIFWLDMSGSAYRYEVEQRPILPVGYDWPPWMPVTSTFKDSY